MKTRFDNREFWIKSDGTFTRITNMDTGHLMSILAMFITKPKSTVRMLIEDIEKQKKSWAAFADEELVYASLMNVTNMTFDEIVTYSLSCPLAASIKQELQSRGINVDNYIVQIKKEVK